MTAVICLFLMISRLIMSLIVLYFIIERDGYLLVDLLGSFNSLCGGLCLVEAHALLFYKTSVSFQASIF